MPRLTITVDEKSYQALVARAVDARRDTRDEAALLVERALRRAARPPGALAPGCERSPSGAPNAS